MNERHPAEFQLSLESPCAFIVRSIIIENIVPSEVPYHRKAEIGRMRRIRSLISPIFLSFLAKLNLFRRSEL